MNTTTKTFYMIHNVGKCKYSVRFHDGVKTYNDGSALFDIAIFKNKKKLKTFADKLRNEQFIEL